MTCSSCRTLNKYRSVLCMDRRHFSFAIWALCSKTSFTVGCLPRGSLSESSGMPGALMLCSTVREKLTAHGLLFSRGTSNDLQLPTNTSPRSRNEQPAWDQKKTTDANTVISSWHSPWTNWLYAWWWTLVAGSWTTPPGRTFETFL